MVKKIDSPTKYVSKKPDKDGFVNYDTLENETWKILMHRQMPIVANRACQEYLEGLDILQFSEDAIPQLPDVNKRMHAATGWQVEPVSALIGYQRFFELLASKKFPAATFIRTREELDYLQEPDIFHELFGHCPMLTNPIYADFMQKYGEIGVNANEKDQIMLLRLYWFTVEFGLINTTQGLKIYGGGILSSISETPYSIESETPQRKLFDLVDIFRTPYRIDILQTIYFVINDYETLYNILVQDLFGLIREANQLGMHEPSFPPKETN